MSGRQQRAKSATDNYEYDPDDVLGSGAACTVYRGRALDSGEVVAVKVVRAEMEKDFEKEVGILMALSHPNIVHVLAYKSVSAPAPRPHNTHIRTPTEKTILLVFTPHNNAPQPCIVLEYCDGGDLGKILASTSRPFSEERTRFWMQQLGEQQPPHHTTTPHQHHTKHTQRSGAQWRAWCTSTTRAWRTAT